MRNPLCPLSADTYFNLSFSNPNWLCYFCKRAGFFHVHSVCMDSGLIHPLHFVLEFLGFLLVFLDGHLGFRSNHEQKFPINDQRCKHHSWASSRSEDQSETRWHPPLWSDFPVFLFVHNEVIWFHFDQRHMGKWQLRPKTKRKVRMQKWLV
jgi:hypothetical protein